MELVLESNSEAHSSKDEDIFAQSDTDTDINFTQWTDNTSCRPTVPVVHMFTQDLSGLQQTEPPHINNETSYLAL